MPLQLDAIYQALALDIARVDGAADILDRGVAQDLDLPCLLVDLDVDVSQTRAGALRVD
jgi:hypothetical protein